jgi:hypothetical protein
MMISTLVDVIFPKFELEGSYTYYLMVIKPCYKIR